MIGLETALCVGHQQHSLSKLWQSVFLYRAVAKEARNAPALRGLTLGQLGQLPRLELVGVDQDGGDGHQQTVSHVQDADDLLHSVRLGGWEETDL